MKKIVACLAALALAVCVLCGCGEKVTGGERPDAPAFVSAAQVEENLRYFLGITQQNVGGDIGDRTPTSASEKAAAERLYEKYADEKIYPALRVTMLEDTAFEVKVGEQTRTSQNVEIRFNETQNATQKRVIVSAGYDNAYGDYAAEYTGQSATGAFANGTGVATVMSMIDYCNAHADELREKIDFEIVFVFFGCSAYNSKGAEHYLADTMTATQKQNTLLMINVDKMGGDKMYLYANEVSTAHEKFMRDTASAQGLRIRTLPANMPLIEGTYLNDVYYTHFAMIGNHAPFMERDIPTAYLFSGAYGGFNLSDLESKGSANLGGTAHDTFGNLQQKRADYAAQGSDAAALVLATVCAPDFAQTAAASRNTVYDYAFWVSPLWAYLIVIFAVIALAIVLLILVKYFEKKYPYVPVVRKMKIPVFGMEYETPEETDIFVDIKKRGDNPFDGY